MSDRYIVDRYMYFNDLQKAVLEVSLTVLPHLKLRTLFLEKYVHTYAMQLQIRSRINLVSKLLKIL